MLSFGPVHIVEPRAGHPHDRTAIILHGRGSTGDEFVDEFFGTSLSDPQAPTLADRLPTWRWVFPSSPSTWNATFEEWMHAWFEVHSLTNPSARQDLQQPGLRASVRYVGTIVEQEIRRLHTESGRLNAHARIVLGGISQGGAVALWTLLGTDQPERPLGGFVAASTWLPFVGEIKRYLDHTHVDTEIYAEAAAQSESLAETESETENSGHLLPIAFVQNMMAPLQKHLHKRQTDHEAGQRLNMTSILTTPVFLGHGRDDAYVDIDLGRQAHQLLCDVGFTAVEWRDYEGAELEGHWLKEPEEMNDIAQFLEAVADRNQ